MALNEYVNKRIATVKMKISRDTVIMRAIYAPEESKINESIAFYETLQQVFNKSSNTGQINGGLNFCVRNDPIQNIT